MGARRGGGDEDPSEERLDSLASVQTSLLLHALSFPSVKRVVYSTCAVSVVENEAVVSKVLEKLCGWSVTNIMPTWERRGMEEFTDGPNFVRALADEDMCNGFFVAVLERNTSIKHEETNDENVIIEQYVIKAKKKKKLKDGIKDLVDTDIVPDSNMMSKKKKKKSKEKPSEADDVNSLQVTDSSKNEIEENLAVNDDECDLTDKKHKKKKKRKAQEILEESNDLCEESGDVKRSKKMKRDKMTKEEDELAKENELSEKKNKKKKKKDVRTINENESTKENRECNEKSKKKKKKK